MKNNHKKNTNQKNEIRKSDLNQPELTRFLKESTSARIGLGRSGPAVPTQAQLHFQLDHAMARDAVHFPWDISLFKQHFKKEKLIELSTLVVHRSEYLRRPDKGRALTELSEKKLRSLKNKFDVAIVISDGLSALAVDSYGPAFLNALRVRLKKNSLRVAPLILVPNSRVAVSDQIGQALCAKIVIIVIGERPGLSAVDSMAIYLTYGPKRGNTDEKRNCISNIRSPHGLDPTLAAEKTAALITESLKLRLSGIRLKDEFSAQKLVTAAQNENEKQK